ITGTNDTPTVAAALTDTAAEGDSSFSKNLLTGAADPDHGETATLAVADVQYSVDGGLASGTAPAGVSLLGSTLTVDPADAAFDHLAVGEHTTIDRKSTRLNSSHVKSSQAVFCTKKK